MSKILTARMEGLETAMRPSTIIVCGGDLAEAEARIDAMVSGGVIAPDDREHCVAVVTGVPRASMW